MRCFGFDVHPDDDTCWRVHFEMVHLIDKYVEPNDAGLCSIIGPLPKVACVLDSHVVGFAKPDRRIFEMALTSLGISADECLHVGDSVQTDVVGARAAGITPVHVDPYGLCESAHHEHSVSLEDVVNELLG